MTLRIIVSIAAQTAEVWSGDALVRVFPVSTAASGAGCEPGSNKTPVGHFAVAEKIGEGQPLGCVFRSRVPTGEDPALCAPGEDLILTRILWLTGLEEHNANTRERFIYFHGTSDEAGIGLPRSHGCIRLRNSDVVELFALAKVGTPVEIR